ncbi:uncharacterized protein LOC114359786 [Ostrinia furnacalis]|uniref:uncharacterized protein LOC114359786 n=1 Tax=Ostrinia furnacalis TaxID=93504 RepID=UPI00103B05C8|nr:uncharacterized protein LOC114359786 [Ostrinia furnacalis]
MASDSDSASTVMEHDLLRDLIKKRGSEKGKLTLFKKYLAKLDPQAISAEQIIDLELRTDKVRTVFSKFEKIQDRIETLSTDIDKELEERECFENSYYESVARAKNYLNQNKPNNASSNSNQDRYR